MTRVFVKWYNPAYDYFLVRFFAGRGIPFDYETTYQQIRLQIPTIGRVKLLPHERLFVDYIGEWRLHPESRPSQTAFLRNIFDDGRLTVTRLEELEASLPREKGKLLLSQDDVAADISKFYRRIVINPLRNDIEKKASPWKLLDYFNPEDKAGLPYSREVDLRDFERAVKAMAKDSLSWLDQMKVQTISTDIDLVFQQHVERGRHMEPIGAPRDDGRRTMRCEHNYKLVQLHCSREPDDFEDYLLLQPARGYGVVEDGWKDIIFPRFNVFEEPEGAYGKNITPIAI